MKILDTNSFLTDIVALAESGKEVITAVSGGSMSPFLIGGRDFAVLKKPFRKLKKGDIVLFKRSSGNYVLHRIRYIKKDGCYTVGDFQQSIEGPINEQQICAIVTAVKRNGKWLYPKSPCWKFYATVWLYAVPVRHLILKASNKLKRKKAKSQ